MPFYLPSSPTNQNIKKMKKMPGDVILHKCTKNYFIALLLKLLYCSCMVHDRYNCHFSFWAIFCPFTPTPHPPPLTAQKIKILKKWKKPLEIPSFYICAPKIMTRWCTVPEIWCATDGWIDRWTYGKSHRVVGDPPNKKHFSLFHKSSLLDIQNKLVKM